MRFPNEDRKYRNARDALLKEEMALRRQIEAVAALRRKLPAGGEAQDYVFDSEEGSVRLSELFRNGSTLVAYSFMYAPKMKRACPSCTSILDGLDGAAQHLAQVTNLVVIAKSPLARIREHARKRGWRHLKLLSSENNTYNRDYGAETADGSQMPMMNVFRKDGSVRHFWGSELLYAKTDRGQEPRHVDFLWPIWNVLDVTPEGRGKDWNPKLAY